MGSAEMLAPGNGMTIHKVICFMALKLPASTDWFKGKSTSETKGFSQKICGLPVIFPSTDPLKLSKNGQVTHWLWKKKKPLMRCTAKKHI